MAPQYENKLVATVGMKRAAVNVLNDTAFGWMDNWNGVTLKQKQAATSAMIAKKSWADPSFQRELRDLKRRDIVPKNKIKTEESLQKMLDGRKSTGCRATWRVKLFESVRAPTAAQAAAVLYEKRGLGLFEGLPLAVAREEKADLIDFIQD